MASKNRAPALGNGSEGTTRWANRIVRSAEVAPATLSPSALNWRTHPQAQQSALHGALDHLGWIQQLVVNERTGAVIDGHLRLRLALEQGQPTVPVLYVDLSEEEERLALVTLDPIAAMAGADREALSLLLQDVQVADVGLLQMLEGLAVQYAVIPPEPALGSLTPPAPSGQGQEEEEQINTTAVPAPDSNIRMVQLFLTVETFPRFQQAVKALGEIYGLTIVTDIVLEAITRATVLIDGAS